MTTSGEKIVAEYVASGWKTNPFDQMLPLLQDHREEALPLALMVIERVPKGGTFFDLLLSHLNEGEFRQVIEVALIRIASGSNHVLDSVFSYAAIQFPTLLRPHLRAIFEFRPNSGAYYEEWPWHGADSEEIARLKEIVTSDTDNKIRERAWRCLVGTRQAECIEFAALNVPMKLEEDCGFEVYANLAGFDAEKSPPRMLHTESAHHIIFPVDFFSETERPAWLAHANHPTWSLNGSPVAEAEFGGDSSHLCGSCDAALHRLVRFDNADKVLGIRLPKIELSTCLSCLGWEQSELFFFHDDSGVPSPYSSTSPPRNPEFKADPLKASSVSIQLSASRWQVQDWALSNSRENLNRIGGSPSWIQDSQYPQCPKCRELMTFIMQLDSDLPTNGGEEWLWGSGGIAYFFWCDGCAISGNLWQCT